MSQLLLQEEDLSSTYESHYGILNIREVPCTIFKFVSLSLENQKSLCHAKKLHPKKMQEPSNLGPMSGGNWYV